MNGTPTLFLAVGTMVAVLFFIVYASQRHDLSGIKDRTVGNGQHGTARWATKQEVKYAKILAKTIISPEGDSASHGQNAYFYDAAEGLLASVVLLLSEFLPPEETNGYEVRHISTVFKLVQELLREGSFRGQNQFQELMTLLPDDHKAKWLAGSALTASDQAMNSVMSTVLSKLNALLNLSQHFPRNPTQIIAAFGK